MGYRVEWSIDIFDAASPEEAARKAHYLQTKPGSDATVFDVYLHDGDGVPTKVDLEELDG